MKWIRPALWILTAQLLAASAVAQTAADRLLKLVPEDAGMTAVVENFRDRRAPFLSSPIASQISHSPDVRAWWNAHGKAPWDSLEASMKAATGLPMPRIVDDLFGDAVVLSIDLPKDGGPQNAKGLFLLAPRNPALLKRLVDQINTHEKTAGTLLEVVPRKTEHGTYSLRRFQPGTKPEEAYVIVDDAILAWSNSEDLIAGVLKRNSAGGGLSNNPRFKAVRESLPADALLSLFIDPRFVERLASKSPKAGARDEAQSRLVALFERYLSATQYAGASLVWRDGPALETFEAIDPGKLDLPLRKWTGRTEGGEDLLARVPSTAFWVIAARMDLVALLDLMLDVVPESERERTGRILDAARGLLLGRDLREEILPALGPGVVAYSDMAEGAKPEVQPSLVVGVEIGKAHDVRAPLENALRTFMNLISLDAKKSAEESQIRVQERDGQTVVSLGQPPNSVSYAVTPEVLAIGNDPERVAGFIANRRPEAQGSFATIPDRITRTGGFAVVNLDRVTDRVSSQRDRFAKEWNLSVADLDGLLAASRLFRLGYVTTTVAKDSASVRRSLGLLGKPSRP